MTWTAQQSAALKPIISMSMTVRTGGALVPGQYGSSLVVQRASANRDWLREAVIGADQVLCGTNKSRHIFNDRIRQIKGMPVKGDRLVCLRNNHEKGLLNGGIWQVDSVSGSPSKIFRMNVISLDDPGIASPVPVKTSPLFFRGLESGLDWRERKRMDEFAFGYVLTVHKSQGSQWDNVLVFDESRAFGDDAKKHLYTAITRAADRVTVIVD